MMGARGAAGAHEARASWDPNVLPGPQAKDELVLLSVESMRTRRRPMAIALLWAWQAALAVLVAWPAAAAVGGFYGAHPGGDSPLWTPGGLPLMDLLTAARGVRGETATLAFLVLFVAGFADLVPLAAMLASIGYVTRDMRAPSLRAALARGAGVLPTFATLFAMASLLEGALVIFALLVGYALSDGLASKLGEARADQTAWIATLAILSVAGVVGVMHDLARAASVRFRVKALRAWKFAYNALARGAAQVLWGWAWRTLAGWAVVGVGALVAARFGGHGGAELAVLAVAHQAVTGARVALRASWLAKAMRAVDRAHKVVSRRRA
jgi:hypothetical protein